MPEIRLIEDYGNKQGLHTKKNEWWLTHNIEVTRYPLPCADYILVNDRVQEMLDRKKARGIPPKKMDFAGLYDVAVDSKRDILEICGNVCGKSHARFIDEVSWAKNNGVKLYILVENDEQNLTKDGSIKNEVIHSLDELPQWKNPRLFIRKGGKQLYPTATRGITLFKALKTIETKYGCTFVFCSSNEAAQKIVELLKGEM